MRSFKDSNRRCSRCYQRKEICICPILPTVKTRAEFLVLRHIKEAERASNTGRLVALAMPNSRIVSCGGGGRIGISSPDDELLRPGTYLLWPDGTSTPQDILDLTPPDRVVVLDATWRQARRLYSRTPVLQAIPRLALTAPTRYRERLRDQHRADGMSTLEAVAAAVSQLEGAETAEPLERLYDEVVRRTIALRWGLKTDLSVKPRRGESR
jgi:DTW domain-containing protein